MIRSPQGPWLHRFLLYLVAVAFGLLIYWLLGFVMRDIATWPGPDVAMIEESMLDPQQRADLVDLRQRIMATRRAIDADRQRQAVLRDSTGNSERTMNQLLELQRLTLQRELTPSPGELEALAESQRLFLANQTRYQEINDRISNRTEELESLEDNARTLEAQLAAQRSLVQEEVQRRYAHHQWRRAAVKLLVLLPVLVAAVIAFVRFGSGLYAPAVWAFGIAVVIQVGWVMHEHFPRRYFKYLLIGVAILLASRLLLHLIRLRAFPRPDWLLKQYREAYEHFQCPICAYPIRRGPLKFLFWNRRSIRRLHPGPDPAGTPDEPYVCPVCATRLFEECGHCHATRPSLLPACPRCGSERPFPPPVSTGTP
ncbi:MAG: hypothetical protein KF833_06275 [Verrucomicrobiae bacterium]|nr:hypothetical protein [Verrucomicrobiae bacterium]